MSSPSSKTRSSALAVRALVIGVSLGLLWFAAYNRKPNPEDLPYALTVSWQDGDSIAERRSLLIRLINNSQSKLITHLPTDVFDGTLWLLTKESKLRQFEDESLLEAKSLGLLDMPVQLLEPGESFAWKVRPEGLIEVRSWTHSLTENEGSRVIPHLAQELLSGRELWCEVRIYPPGSISEGIRLKSKVLRIQP